MSDLPTPITREEQFLNGIAQGDTSNLPTPVGREEKYLDYIARNGGGGGGGTTNYNALDNKPQIAGTTLQGNKSLADLGIASASDVATALAGKVDKVEGKGLSTNDYDNTEKAEVAKVAGKAEKTATASGETLALAPTSEGKALIHTAYGMSVQNGTPTPSSPVDIESAKVNLRSKNKNFIKFPYSHLSDTTVRGIAWSNGDDGAVIGNGTWNGTSSSQQPYCEVNGFANNDRYSILLPDIWYTIESIRDSQYAIGTNVYFLDENNSQKSIPFVYCVDGGAEQSKSGSFVYQMQTDNVVHTVSFKVSEKVAAQVQVRYMSKTQAGDVAYTVTNDKQYPILMVGKYSSLQEMLPYVVGNYTDLTTDLTLRAIEVSSSDAYNLVRGGKYYIADTLDYDEDNGFVVTRRVGIEQASNLTWSGVDVNGYTGVNSAGLNNVIATTTQNPLLTKYFQPTHALGVGNVPDNAIAKFNNININTTVVSGATTNAERKTMWDTWLSTHDFDIYYILITPTTELITTEQNLDLLSLKTYDESTSISSQAEPSCTVAIEYAKERLAAVALIAHNLAKGNDLRIAELEETP